MAEKYITKNKRVRAESGEMVEVSTKYRIDADFVPENINEVCLEFIVNYCKANKEVDWLKETANKFIIDKKEVERRYPFVKLRADFMNKFFPSKVKGKAEKAPNMYDLINSL